MSDQRRLEEIRRDQGPLGNELIDQLVTGSVSRRDFVRRGTIIGLSLPTLGAIIAACGGSKSNDAPAATDAAPATTQSGGAGAIGATSEAAAPSTEAAATTEAPAAASGTLRVALQKPSTASANIDPVAINDQGGLNVLAQVGEYLTFSQGDLTLAPMLATEWSANADATEWTFKLAPEAVFSDGTPVTAADVVATVERLVNPDNKSNALSAFNTGNLGPGGTSAVDDKTVLFKLSAPFGNFPYVVSSDNYNAIILPASVTDTTQFGSAGIPTSGPWKIDKFDAVKGISLVQNENYWGSKPLVEKLEIIFFDDTPSQVTAFQGGQVDVIPQFSVQGGQALLSDPDATIIELRAATHRQVHMRVDKGPFKDKRVRQALALALNRPDIVQSLFQGKADIGNDSPFAPVYPSTDTTVPQRELDMEKAKALMAEAGGGFKTTLYTWNNQEMPDYAALIKNAAKEIGIEIDLQIRDDYYEKYWIPGDGAPGSDIGITDYGHRGVPNVYLTAALKSPDKGGVWNSAQYANPAYDKLVDEYAAASELEAQKAIAKQIEEMLLEDTPIIFGYFYNYLTATKKNVTGVVTSAMGSIFFDKAAIGV